MNTLGPLTLRAIEASDVPANNIGIMADAGPGDVKEAILSDELSAELPAGHRLGETANDGPAFWDPLQGPVVESSSSRMPSTARTFRR